MRKMLKIVSIIMVVFAALNIIGGSGLLLAGLFRFATGDILAYFGSDYASIPIWEYIGYLGIVALAIGTVELVGGILRLIAGIAGINSTGRKASGFRRTAVWGWICFIYSILTDVAMIVAAIMTTDMVNTNFAYDGTTSVAAGINLFILLPCLIISFILDLALAILYLLPAMKAYGEAKENAAWNANMNAYYNSRNGFFTDDDRYGGMTR